MNKYIVTYEKITLGSDRRPKLSFTLQRSELSLRPCDDMAKRFLRRMEKDLPKGESYRLISVTPAP